jgi:hypothetical protein
VKDKSVEIDKLFFSPFLLGAENNWQCDYSQWLIHDASAKGIRHIVIK